jgi:hypothetical protein
MEQELSLMSRHLHSDKIYKCKYVFLYFRAKNCVSVKEYTSADMDVTRATAATRVDENGLMFLIGINTK